MTKFSAKAHTRTDYNYSNFHKSLLHENNSEDYALRHIYSLENTKHLLEKWGWTPDQIKAGIDHATIDIYEKIVYLHIPNFIIKRGSRLRIRGISRFISKADYVQILIDRAWAKADPYKLQPGSDWNELIAMGNTGDFYELNLTLHEITCTCHAYSGLKKAFEQDATAIKHLIANPITQGQIPDKHIFAVWKYLGAECQRHYEYQFMERRDRFLEEKQRTEWSFDEEEKEELEIEF
ncbi:hypothetical protein SD81_016960 [Tolypothrix campylonemoides VB511288]|nr:hypothetical protein SD81_016960 [Tolypothrix campylonemoides VB511288]